MTKLSPASSRIGEPAPPRGKPVALRQRGDERLALHDEVLELARAAHWRSSSPKSSSPPRAHRPAPARASRAARGSRRVRRLVGLEQSREHAVVGERDEADAQLPVAPAAMPRTSSTARSSCWVARRASSTKRAPSAVSATRRRVRASKQHAELLLQGADGARERRPARCAAPRGAAEMQVVGTAMKYRNWRRSGVFIP